MVMVMTFGKETIVNVNQEEKQLEQEYRLR